MTRDTPALRALFAALLPGPDETRLLRAALLGGGAGTEAWTECQKRLGDLAELVRGDTRGLKRWLPLLQHALQRDGREASPALATLLRTARFQEELRTQAYTSIVRETLAQLRSAGVPFLALKGLALARCYPEASLRHSHDLELLLPEPTALDRSATGLREGGVRCAAAQEPGCTGALLLMHESGLPIRLSTRLFRTPHYAIRVETLWLRRVPAILAEEPAEVLAPDDALLHVLGHAAESPSRSSLQWVADAWFLLARHPDLDWDRLLDSADVGGLRLVVAALLEYLARELGAQIPAATLARATNTARAPRIERDALLSAVRASGEGELRRMLARLPSPRERLRLLCWLLGPSPAYLRRLYRLPSAAVLPLLYLYRPFAYAARRLPRRLRTAAP